MVNQDISEELFKLRKEEGRTASRYLRIGTNPLIDLAVINLWTRSLEDILRDMASSHRERHGGMPNTSAFDEVRMGTDDLKYYQQNGQPHIAVDTLEIYEARERAGLWQYREVEYSHDGKEYRITSPDESYERDRWDRRLRRLYEMRGSTPNDREGMLRVVRAAAAQMDMGNAIKPRPRPSVVWPDFEALQRNSPNNIHRRLP